MRRAVLIIAALAACGVALITIAGMMGGGAPAVPSAAASSAPDVSFHPAQSDPASRGDITHITPSGTFTLTPLADYDVSALVVGAKRYTSGWAGDLAPVDLALAWGRVTDSENLRHITFRQSGRWYYFEYDAASPLNSREIAESSANTHCIPATSNIETALRRIRRGDRVRLTGKLVSVMGRVDGHDVRWKSSLSRQDSGNQSCELMLIEQLQVGDQLYR